MDDLLWDPIDVDGEWHWVLYEKGHFNTPIKILDSQEAAYLVERYGQFTGEDEEEAERPQMTKVYKLIVLVVDHNNIGAEEVVSALENTKYPNDCMSPEVLEIDW